MVTIIGKMHHLKEYTMSDKSLKDKAIDFKGKKYVLVADRVIYFNEHYPTGSIVTDLVSDPESDQIIVKATVYPDITPTVVDKAVGNYAGLRQFTGYSQAIKGDGYINKTAALENAETSAVGRALAMMGIGVLDSIASVDEVNKAQGSTGQRQLKLATPKQIEWMRDEAHKANDQLGEDEETDTWITTILTIKPQQVPVFKVKDAVDKIREEGKPETADTDLDDIEVTDEQIEDLKNGKIPY